MAALLAGVASLPAPASTVPTGLVAAFSFDEEAGVSVGDSSGNGNVGTISGATWTAAGKYGGALTFDGINDSVTVADSDSLDVTTGVTIEAWVKQASGGSAWHTIALKERPGGMVFSLYGKTGNSGAAGHFVVGSTEQRARYGTRLANDVWSHVAATYDGAVIRVYLNGNQVVTRNAAGTVTTSTGVLRLGGNAVWSEWFRGVLDEVRIYNRALSVGEIQADMASPIGLADTTPPSPPGGLTQSGATEDSVTLVWSASTDDAGVAGYGLYRDAAPAGSSTGTSGTIGGLSCGTTYTAGADAFDAAGNRSSVSTAPVTTAACDTTPPTVEITAPTGGVVSGIVQLQAEAADNTRVAGVQFRVNGAGVGPPDTAAPYATDWNTTAVANGAYSLTAVATDSSGNQTISAPVTVSVFQPVVSFTNETILYGLNEPTDMLFTPDGRMLVSERTGRIRVRRPGAAETDATPLIELTDIYAVTDERGLLGIALDPDFATNGYIYLHYTHSSLKNRVSRFTVFGDTANPLSEHVLWQNDMSSAVYHSGGQIAFGPDGYLYVAVGDRLDPDSAQRLDTFNGKILRIGRDGSVPVNPFYDGTGPNRDEIWAYGLRNPWRFSFDSVTGRMYIADVGQNDVEEVNLGQAGRNFGWPTCEGPCGRVGLTDPIYSYPHDGGGSITGGFVYRGTAYPPEYRGNYFFADYVHGWIRRLAFHDDGSVATVREFAPPAGSAASIGNIVSFAPGPDGSIYYVDIGPFQEPNTGTVRRIRNTTANQPPIAQFSASPEGGPAPLDVSFSSEGSGDPEGQPVTYRWDFGDGTSSTEADPSHTYARNGAYVATLVVGDGANETVSAPQTINVGNRPTPTISMPATGATFRAGDQLTFTGSASDPEDGALPDSSLSWSVVFLHDAHQHPAASGIAGASGSYSVPLSGHDFGGDTRYQITLTAVDSDGLRASTSVIVRPEKVTLGFESSPAGATITIDGITRTTPFAYETLVGFQHHVSVPTPQVLEGIRHRFVSWSDNGARVRTITVPDQAQTLAATFERDPTNTGLVAAYGLDTAGAIVSDTSGNGNHGTLVGPTWTSAGRFGGALSFDGVNDWVTAGDSTTLDLTTGMTLEAWVRTTGGGAWRTVAIKEQPGDLVYALYARTSKQGRPSGHAFLNGDDQRTYGTSAVPAGVWTHLAVTYDGSAIRLFVDGAQISQVTAFGAMPNSAGALRLGGNAVWNEWFQGQIDEVRIYNRALSAAEIQVDMNTPVGG